HGRHPPHPGAAWPHRDLPVTNGTAWTHEVLSLLHYRYIHASTDSTPQEPPVRARWCPARARSSRDGTGRGGCHHRQCTVLIRFHEDQADADGFGQPTQSAADRERPP